MSGSWGHATFDRLYADSSDPWDYQTSPYEQAKYQATIAALPARRLAAGFEAGCSIGVLTRMLAGRCDRLLSVDTSDIALRLAMDRCKDQPWVQFARMSLPHEWPQGETFDVMIFSEMLYFLDAADVRLTASQTVRTLASDGTVVLVNWIGATDTPTTGDSAAEFFIAASGLPVLRQQREQANRLDVLARSR